MTSLHPRRSTISAPLPQKNQPDFLDRIFEWTEFSMCPSSMKHIESQPPDTLDYVFEHVESFVCQEEPTEEPEAILLGQPRNIVRDNSLVEVQSNGQVAKLQTKNRVSKLDQEGDMLDYVFEHVESFVCNEDHHVSDEQKIVVRQGKENKKRWFTKKRRRSKPLRQEIVKAAERETGRDTSSSRKVTSENEVLYYRPH